MILIIIVQGVELGRRLGESGGATTIQKLAVQMLSNQVSPSSAASSYHQPHHPQKLAVQMLSNQVSLSSSAFHVVVLHPHIHVIVLHHHHHLMDHHHHPQPNTDHPLSTSWTTHGSTSHPPSRCRY